MINIRVSRDGNVTGDVGAVIGNESTRFSCPIRIIHPDFQNVIHTLKYRQGRQQMKDIINCDDLIRLSINQAGMLRVQYVAEDATTGVTVFASNPFNLIIQKSLAPCRGEDPRHRLLTPDIMQHELEEISLRLKEVGILTTDSKYEVLDCNDCVWDKEYLVGVASRNTPEGKSASKYSYLLRTKSVGQSLLQFIACTSPNSTSIYYRQGTVYNQTVTYTSWEPMIYKGATSTVEADDVNDVPTSKGQYVIIKNADGTYSQYYDTEDSNGDIIRILLTSNNTGNLPVISCSSISSNTYTVQYNTPLTEGFSFIFIPKISNDPSNITYIDYNGTKTPIYIRKLNGDLETMLNVTLTAPCWMMYKEGMFITNAAMSSSGIAVSDLIADHIDVNNLYTQKAPSVKAVVDYQREREAIACASYHNESSAVNSFLNCVLSYFSKLQSNVIAYGSDNTALDDGECKNIDLLTLIKLSLRGVDYDHSRYVKDTNEIPYEYSYYNDILDKSITFETLYMKMLQLGHSFALTSVFANIRPGDIVLSDNNFICLYKEDDTYGILTENDNKIAIEEINISDLPTLGNVIRPHFGDAASLYSFNLVNNVTKGENEWLIELNQTNTGNKIYTVVVNVTNITEDGKLSMYIGDELVKQEVPILGTNEFKILAPEDFDAIKITYTGTIDENVCVYEGAVSSYGVSNNVEQPSAGSSGSNIYVYQ